MAKEAENEAAEDFLDTLENGVRSVIRNKKASASEKVAAIAAGVKVALIRHRISGEDEKSFFS